MAKPGAGPARQKIPVAATNIQNAVRGAVALGQSLELGPQRSRAGVRAGLAALGGSGVGLMQLGCRGLGPFLSEMAPLATPQAEWPGAGNDRLPCHHSSPVAHQRAPALQRLALAEGAGQNAGRWRHAVKGQPKDIPSLLKQLGSASPAAAAAWQRI